MAPRKRILPRYMINREGRYWSRLVVPVALRPYLEGKTELRTPLGGDYRAAQKAHHGAVAELQHRIAVAERQAARVTGRPADVGGRYLLQPEALARRHYLAALAHDEELRDDPLYHLGYATDESEVAQLRAGIAGSLSDDGLKALVGVWLARARALGYMDAEKGTPEWRAVARAFCVAEYEALSRIVERDEGNFAGKPEHPMLVQALAVEEVEPLPPVSLRGLFADYLKAKAAIGRARVTGHRWKSVIESMVEHMKGDDARAITTADVRAWRDKLMETKAAKTVADGDLAALRAILKWAHEDGRLPFNAAEGVKQPKPKVMQTREKGYTDAEALAVLKAARAYVPKPGPTKSTTETEEVTRAKRWLPWLCAFSGARVTEMAQLRGQDFRQEDGGWVLRITPEAGSTKSGHWRDVPVHPQLVELGLLKMVEEVGQGPLFWRNVPVDRDPLKAAQRTAMRVSSWVAGLELAPESVAPNHGWRHRFKSQSMDLGLAARVVDALQDHAPRTAGESYGDVSLSAKRRAIESFPAYKLD